MWLFTKLEHLLKQNQEGGDLIVLRDWTLDFTLDRNDDEPHSQYTKVKANTALSLEGFSTSWNLRNRALNTAIVPTSLSDHKLITAECVLVTRAHCY